MTVTVTPTSFSESYDAREVEELRVTTQEALDAIPSTTYVSLPRQVATGTAGAPFARIGRQNASPPLAVSVVRVRESLRPGDDVAAVPRLNFGQQDSSVVLYEPSGLTAGTMYDLVVQIVEAT